MSPHSYQAPSSATLTFDKHDLARLIGHVRNGDSALAMAELQNAANAAGKDTREIFEQAKTLSHSPVLAGASEGLTA